MVRDGILLCENCRVVSSPNEAVWNKAGERICLYCCSKDEIADRSDWLKKHEEEYAEIESRFDILDL